MRQSSVVSPAPAFLPSILFRYRTFLKYCTVGTCVTAADFFVFALCFYYLTLPSVPSKLIAFSCAVVLSYAFNRKWTFRSRDPRIHRQFTRFVSVSLIGAALSSLTIYSLIDLLHIHPLLANGMTSSIVLSWNFFANKYWTFRIPRRPLPLPEPPRCHLSVVIPAYNEEHRLGRTLQEDLAYLGSQNYSWEIIVIDDGSSDATSATVRHYEEQCGDRIRLLRLPRNRGKGAAVQMGVINARGRFIMIADADNATPIEEVGRFLAESSEGEILIGSRYIGSSIIGKQQSRARILIGRLGNLLIRAFLVDGISDTQCGFKLFPAAIARELFARQRVMGWGFDMEILAMAQGLGIPIREKGVVWRDVPGSRLRPLRDAIKVLRELGKIKINMWSGVYD